MDEVLKSCSDCSEVVRRWFEGGSKNALTEFGLVCRKSPDNNPTIPWVLPESNREDPTRKSEMSIPIGSKRCLESTQASHRRRVEAM